MAELERRLPLDKFSALKAITIDGRIHLIQKRARSMRDSATLDDLACLLMLLRQANDVAEGQTAFQLARYVNHVLLLQAGWLFEHGLLRPFIEYVDQAFFARVPVPLNGITSAEVYFHQLGWLIRAVTRKSPEAVDGFDAALWHRSASAALRDVETL